MNNKGIFTNFKEIETERLIIRKITFNDVDSIFEFTSLPETCEKLTWYPHENKERTLSFINSIVEKYEKDSPAQWGIHLKQENKIIGIGGFITLSNEHRKGEIA